MGAVGGVLADSWREYFYCNSLDANTLVAKGHKRTSAQGRSSNTLGEDNIISDGSVIAVNEGQYMIIVEQGAVVEACGEPGEFVFDSSTEPSLFFDEGGSLGERIRASFERVGTRFSFGGDTGKDQRVYFFNAKEIVGNKYGTAAPVPFRVVDNNIGLDVDISVRCNGEYSYRIVDPLMFYKNVCGNVEQPYTRDKIDSQLKIELLTALQPAFARISAMGVRYSAVPAHTKELAQALNEELSQSWGADARHRGGGLWRELHRCLPRGRGHDQGAAEGGRHARSHDGGGKPCRVAGRRHAHGSLQQRGSGRGVHGHGDDKRHGWRCQHAGALRHGLRRRCASQGWCGTGCGRDGGTGCGARHLDLLVRRPKHRALLRQLRKPKASAHGRAMDLLVRHAEHETVLRQLRKPAPVGDSRDDCRKNVPPGESASPESLACCKSHQSGLSGDKKSPERPKCCRLRQMAPSGDEKRGPAQSEPAQKATNAGAKPCYSSSGVWLMTGLLVLMKLGTKATTSRMARIT
jgi:membrane protease subunit (stomatin/prohibitin family)